MTVEDRELTIGADLLDDPPPLPQAVGPAEPTAEATAEPAVVRPGLGIGSLRTPR
jgi:hypothetical protein